LNWASLYRITASGGTLIATDSFDEGANSSITITPPSGGGGRITFSVPVDTKRIDRIGVPFIPFCE